MVSQVVPFSLFVATKGVIHFYEFRPAKAPSVWKTILAIKFMEMAVILAGAGAFFYYLLTTGHVLQLVAIALLAVLGDRLVRALCFYLATRRFCETTGRARHCDKQYSLLQCLTSVNCENCESSSYLLKRTGHFSSSRPRPTATKKKPHHAKAKTEDVW